MEFLGLLMFSITLKQLAYKMVGWPFKDSAMVPASYKAGETPSRMQDS